MGVPAFYRWLSAKYPKIVQDVLEERIPVQGATPILPLDWSGPNPSQLECDNLYIDMNGIIHPCSHPEQGPQPSCEEEMYENVCLAVDRLVRVNRPRRLLYLAIDGVAPRAKMNQQRSRRFRSAQETREGAETEEAIRQKLMAEGQSVPTMAKKAWDSNVITPGTPFMLRLAEYVRFYIRRRISQDKNWKNLKVIFSDASISGEGEHKIMSHIRLQRTQPGYNPNVVHVLHGLDADLIMLALATHEAHFYISRERVDFGQRHEAKQEQKRLESGFADAQKLLDEAVGAEAMQLLCNAHTPLERVSIPILREYLAAEFDELLRPGVLECPSLERIIDDVIFFCFFVGNDFLPHLPSLDIRDGALDFLFNVYRRLLPAMGYITESGGRVNLQKVDIILGEVGSIEDYVFKMKYENEQQDKRRREEQNTRRRKGVKADAPDLQSQPVENHKKRGRAAKILERSERQVVPLSRGHKAKEEARKDQKAKQMLAEDNSRAATELRQSLLKTSAPSEEKSEEVPVTEPAVEESPEKEEAIDEDDDDDDDDDEEDEVETPVASNYETSDPEVLKKFKEISKAAKQKQLDDLAKNVQDNVRLHETGWKDRYYSDKCKADDLTGDGRSREDMFRSYVMGLCWVMKYYFDGCPSWKWYYPYHYGPFASDLRNIERFEKDCRSFQLSTPFNPVEQLLAVLPSDSKHAVPKASQWLMDDPESPIIDFYPKDVPVDPNGKAMPWLWVVLLPFIEEERLLDAMSPTMEKWTETELLCNARGMDDGYLYISIENALVKKVDSVIKSKGDKSVSVKLSDSAAYGSPGFSGSVRMPLSNEAIEVGTEVARPPSSDKIKDNGNAIFDRNLTCNEAICIAFTEPRKYSHKSVLLPGVRLPKPTLSARDKEIRRPCLNRSKNTIANLGTGNGQSYRQGYGSMNMGTGERELAERTGRGHQMYQPGIRQWGAMEPAPKRQRPNHHHQGSAHGNYQQQQQQQQQHRGQQGWNGNQQHNWNQQQQQQPAWNAHQHAQQGGQQHWNAHSGNHYPQQGYQSHGNYQNHGQYQNQGYQNQGQYHNQQGYQHNGQYQHQQQQRYQSHQQGPPRNQQGGFNFRDHNRGQQQQGRPPPPRVGEDKMSRLRSQLRDTIQRSNR